MAGFEPVWASLLSNLKAGTIVRSWTALRGYLGDKMTIVNVRERYIEVDTAGGMRKQVIPKSDFEAIWEIWPDYKARRRHRYETGDSSRFSKYVVSIMHWFEEKG